MSIPLRPKRGPIFCASMGVVSMCVCILVMYVYAYLCVRGRRGPFGHFSGDRPIFGSGDGDKNSGDDRFARDSSMLCHISDSGDDSGFGSGDATRENSQNSGDFRGPRGSPL